jgi:hypothetical protein
MAALQGSAAYCPTQSLNRIAPIRVYINATGCKMRIAKTIRQSIAVLLRHRFSAPRKS